MSTRRFFLPLLIMPLLVCCCSLFASNLDEVVMNNVFSTYKVGSYLFVARYGGNLNNTTPVYVGNMTVSENQTLDISGYWDSVGNVPVVVAQTVKVYLNPRTNEPYNYPYPFTSVTSPHITLNGNTAETPLPAVPDPTVSVMYQQSGNDRTLPNTVSAAKLSAKNNPNVPVTLTSVVISFIIYGANESIESFYVQEQFAGGCGIRVISSTGSFSGNNLSVGKVINSLTGTPTPISGELCLLTDGTVSATTANGVLTPVSMHTVATIGMEYGAQEALCKNPYESPVVYGENVNRVGTLVRVWGKITAIDNENGTICIDNNSDVVAVGEDNGIKVKNLDITHPTYQIGAFITVTGVLGVDPASYPGTRTPIVYTGAATGNYLGSIMHVDGYNGSDDNDGLTWATAKQTIPNAVAAVCPGGEVWVKAYEWYNLPAGWAINKPVKLYGGFNGTETSRNQRNWYANKTELRLYIASSDPSVYESALVANKPVTVSGFTISVFNPYYYPAHNTLKFCSSCEISYNHITGLNPIWVQLEKRETVKIYDNYIALSGCGIEVSTTADKSCNITIENNTLNANFTSGTVGIDLKTSQGNTADNINVINNIVAYSTIGIKKLVASQVPTLNHNCISIEDPPYPPDYTPEQREMLADQYRYFGFAIGSIGGPYCLDLSQIHSIHEDPMLSWYGIDENSPCINAGALHTISRTKDFAYNDRVIGFAIDVGCFECEPQSEPEPDPEEED